MNAMIPSCTSVLSPHWCQPSIWPWDILNTKPISLCPCRAMLLSPPHSPCLTADSPAGSQVGLQGNSDPLVACPQRLQVVIAIICNTSTGWLGACHYQLGVRTRDLTATPPPVRADPRRIHVSSCVSNTTREGPKPHGSGCTIGPHHMQGRQRGR